MLERMPSRSGGGVLPGTLIGLCVSDIGSVGFSVNGVGASEPRAIVIPSWLPRLRLVEQPCAFVQARTLATQRLLQQPSRLPELRDGLVHLNQLLRSERLPALCCPGPSGKAVQESADLAESESGTLGASDEGQTAQYPLLVASLAAYALGFWEQPGFLVVAYRRSSYTCALGDLANGQKSGHRTALLVQPYLKYT